MPQGNRDAAEVFLRKAIRNQGLPEKITVDQSGVNTKAIEHYIRDQHTAILVRHSQGTAGNQWNLVPHSSRAVLCAGFVDNRK